MGKKHIFGFHEVRSLNLWKCALAEVLATCLYIILACGSGLNFSDNPPSILHIAISTGFVVAILASGFWEVSGGHFNPAVTLALTLNGTISLTRFVFYVTGQCVGALAGAWILYAITPEEYQGSLGALSLHPKLSTGIGLVIELILTFQLIWTVIASTDPIRKFTGFQAPIAIGMSVTIGLLMGIPYTGASMNPIRALGPNIIMSKTGNHWVYWVGPFTGSLIATYAYRFIFKLSTEEELEMSQEKASERKDISDFTRSDNFRINGYGPIRSYSKNDYQSLE